MTTDEINIEKSECSSCNEEAIFLYYDVTGKLVCQGCLSRLSKIKYGIQDIEYTICNNDFHERYPW